MSKRLLIAIIFMIAPFINSTNLFAQSISTGIEEILVTAERSEQVFKMFRLLSQRLVLMP